MTEQTFEGALSTLRHRLATPDVPGSQRAVLDAAAEVRRLHRALHDMLSADGRDSEDIPGFEALGDRLALLITNLCEMPATALPGLLAKALAARQFADFENDRACGIAMSLARDLCALAKRD